MKQTWAIASLILAALLPAHLVKSERLWNETWT
jgi:hypothetical protein